MDPAIGRRDANRLTFRDVLPLRQLGAVLRSQTFWMLAGLAGFAVALLNAEGSNDWIIAVGLLMLAIFLFGIRAYMRSNASVLHIAIGAGVVYGFAHSPLFRPWIRFWQFYPSDSEAVQRLGDVDRFLAEFSGAGVPEDLLKVAPIGVLLLAAWVVKRMAGKPPGRLAAFLIRILDRPRPTTILMVALSGAAAFVFFETVELYVPSTIRRQDVAAGIMLLVPRLVRFVFGHGTYAAILGYAIVLALYKARGPVSRALLLACGLVVASSVHALWNTYAGSGLFSQLAVSLLAALALLSITTRARQLDHELAFAAVRPIGDSLVLPPVAPAPRAVGTLVVGATRIALAPEAKLDLAAREPRAAGVALEVVRRAGEPHAYGLRNLGALPWRITTASGRTAEVAPGRVAGISEGVAIDFGPVAGTVVGVTA